MAEEPGKIQETGTSSVEQEDAAATEVSEVAAPTTNSNDITPPNMTSTKPPSLHTANSSSGVPMSSSSSPLSAVNAARRPGLPPARASGLSADIQAKMKAFSLSRQGAPPQNMRPAFPGTLSGGQSVSTGSMQLPTVGGPVTGTPLSGSATNIRLASGMARPNAPEWHSAPSQTGGSPRMMSPRPGMGGLAAKRGLKPGGMKLSDATKPPDMSGQAATAPDTGSKFNKFSNIVDTQKGTLNFKNKAVIHGGGVDFSTGSSFSISLDEVDTLDELGKGNYGTVFKVRHSRPKMRRPGQGLRGNMQRVPTGGADESHSIPTHGTTGVIMAMKEIRLELEDSKFAAIIMELDILHRCISPFIVSFYGAFFQEGSVYICMEYMDGGSIDKLYGDGVPEGVLKKITLSTVMGLKNLKDEHNIIHRDVKPTNVLVNTKGQVKICDFGVSGNLVASIAKTNIGCQSYMAPERISGGGIAQAGAGPGGGTYSVQSDIWSLGLTIIECALGRYPYPPETYDNIFSQLSAIVDGDPPNLPADSFSEAAQDFVRGCLNKIPKLRLTYAMLLRHAWLAPLLKPPTISEDDEAESAAEAVVETSASDLPPDTADIEVASWVAAAIERKKTGKMAKAEKPALHAAPLDAVPGNSMIDFSKHDPANDEEAEVLQPNLGIRIDKPELLLAKVESKDFAS